MAAIFRALKNKSSSGMEKYKFQKLVNKNKSSLDLEEIKLFLGKKDFSAELIVSFTKMLIKSIKESKDSYLVLKNLILYHKLLLSENLGREEMDLIYDDCSILSKLGEFEGTIDSLFIQKLGLYLYHSVETVWFDTHANNSAINWNNALTEVKKSHKLLNLLLDSLYYVKDHEHMLKFELINMVVSALVEDSVSVYDDICDYLNVLLKSHKEMDYDAALRMLNVCYEMRVLLYAFKELSEWSKNEWFRAEFAEEIVTIDDDTLYFFEISCRQKQPQN